MKRSKRRNRTIERDPIRKDWYFEGWERKVVPRTDGPGEKKIFVYTGDYYGFGLSKTDLGRMKLAYALLSVVFCAVYLLISLLPFKANHTNYIGIPLLLMLPPCIYFLMGVVCLLVAKEKMIVRSYYGSVRRIKRSLNFVFPLNGLVILGDIVFLVYNRGSVQMPFEVGFTVGATLSFLCLIGIKLLQSKIPCYVTHTEVR